MEDGLVVMVVAGRMAPKASAWARPIASWSLAMSTTNILVRTTSSSDASSCSSAAAMLAIARRAWAKASSVPIGSPRSPKAVVPVTKIWSPARTARA